MSIIARRNLLGMSFATLACAAGAKAWAAELVPPLRTGRWGFDMTGENPAVSPGDDFFAFANGGFIDALDIPADRSSFGVEPILALIAEKRVREILEATAPPSGPAAADEVKIRALYRAFMDEARVNALGAKPLAPALAQIRAAQTSGEIAAVTVSPEFMGAAPVWVFVAPDAKAPDHYAVQIRQAGLGLPDRNYYLKPEFAEKKAKYQAYVANLLGLAGWPEPAANAQAIVTLETRIAEASWTRVERRDPDKTYNPMSVAELSAAAPGLPWRRMLDAAELEGADRVILGEKSAVIATAAIWAQTPASVLQAWAAFHLADNSATYLSDDFEAAHFGFYGAALAGQLKDRERWKRGVTLANTLMGEAVGRVYVARWFPPEARAKIGALVDDLKRALRGRIERLDWMQAETKRKAMAKLDTMRVKLGYPDKWIDYSGLQITPDDLYGDVVAAHAFEWRRRAVRLNQPVDRTEWAMTPQTVNAYYSATMNEIVFPAAILQPPYFDVSFDAAVNYGSVGGVIGHEMTHAFDDNGRKFDSSGVLANWWAGEDGPRFETRAEVLGRQFDGYEPYPGVHLNGKLTMGENIADLGGLLVALDAYHASLGGKPAPVIDGLSGDQRFFLAYAQSWREKICDEIGRQLPTIDPHSPAKYRVNGVVRNMDAWYAAFAVKPSDRLWLDPDKRVRIW